MFAWDIWVALFFATLVALLCCGVLFLGQTDDDDSWLRSFNLVLCAFLNKDTTFDFLDDELFRLLNERHKD